LSVALYRANGGTAGDVLEFMVNQGNALSHSTVAYSATGPAADSKSTSEVSVGAIDPWYGTTIADYSSRGPTNDGRTKPDLSAASCVTSSIYAAPDCFNGTSAATPVAAGAAALMLDQFPMMSSSQLKTSMLNNATVDRGVTGTDNTYGRGEVILPTPVSPDVTAPSLTGPRATITEGSALGTSLVPYTVTYSGSDASTIARYEVDLSVNGGAWSRLYTGTAKSVSFNATPASRYQVRVKAYDYAANWRMNTSRTFTVSNYGDASANLAYSTGWTSLSATSAYGGAYKYASATNASVRLAFTGDSVTWIATKGANFGSADVYIDGVWKKTVSLYSATTGWRKAVYTWSNTSGNAENHAIKVVARGDGFVAIDSFLVNS